MNLLFVLSFPIVFMIHDFEEIIGIKPWIDHNADYLYCRFPKMAPKFVPHLKHATTRGFAKGVAFMFLLVCLATYLSVSTGYYQIWMGAFMMYAIHVVIHLLQWIAVKRYVPVIITSILSIPYCIYGIGIVVSTFSLIDVAWWTTIAFVITVAMLLFVHRVIIKTK